MTVSRGAAGKAMAMFISSICSRSTAGRKWQRADRVRRPAAGWGGMEPRSLGLSPPLPGDSPMKTKIWWWE